MSTIARSRKGRSREIVSSSRKGVGSDQNSGKVLIVFGGTGFVGSAVLKAALQRNNGPDSHVVDEILVVTRTGRPPSWYGQDSVLCSHKLKFLQGDLVHNPVLELTEKIRAFLRDRYTNIRVLGCISCVGCITPWNQNKMLSVCGDANIHAYQIYRSLVSGSGKFAVITRDRTNWNDWWYPFPWLIPSYYEGKKKIESHVLKDTENFGNAVCLRAGFVVGTRRTLPGMSTDLPVYVPLQCPCRLVGWFCPTVNVRDVGDGAVRFVLSERKASAVIVENEAIPFFFADQ